jgi:hypothetical protein
MRALPTAVWEDHLLPLLTRNEAARLGCTCKALKGVVREHFKGDLGREINVRTLQAALTTFPRARSVAVSGSRDDWSPQRREATVHMLREEGRGRHLEMLTVGFFSAEENFVHEALQAGALPSLRRLDTRLEHEVQRASLTGGFLGAVHELQVTINCRDHEEAPVEPQLAALGLVRQLPALVALKVGVMGRDGGMPVEWPPFIPPSLKALRVSVMFERVMGKSLLCALPGMLEASGARLERLEVHIPDNVKAVGDGLLHLAQALRCCSPTLKGFSIVAGYHEHLGCDYRAPEYEAMNERLRVQWPELLAGVSACRELQVLVLPHILVEPLFPRGTSFDRLTHLEISDHKREHAPDAGVIGLWELLAQGGCPLWPSST